MLARNTDAPVPAPMSARSMISSARAGSHRSMRWMSWPSSIGANTAPSIPVACVTGEPIRFGAPGVIHARMCSNSASSVRWVCITPFGLLVVPDVYASTHTSSGSGAASAAAGARPRRRHPTRPGALAPPARPAVLRREGWRPRRAVRDRPARHAHPVGVGVAVDDAEVVDVPETVGRDVRPGAALGEDEPHLLGPVDVHDRDEHVAAQREAVERDDRFAPVRQLERDHVARLQPRASERGDESERIGADVGVRAVPRSRLRPDVHGRLRRGAQRPVDEGPERVVGPPPRREVALAQGGGDLPDRPPLVVHDVHPRSLRMENQTNNLGECDYHSDAGHPNRGSPMPSDHEYHPLAVAAVVEETRRHPVVRARDPARARVGVRVRRRPVLHVPGDDRR